MITSDTSINARLRHIISERGYDFHEFALRMGWSGTYLSKLIGGNSIGIKPIKALLREFPDLDARWLILGE